MRKYLLMKTSVALLLAVGLTVFLYWPLYQKIPLTNSKSDIGKELNELDLPLNEDIQEILDRKIDLPRDRHELCLENRNRVYLLHADSNTKGVPFTFHTDDISQHDISKGNSVGAMAMHIYYQNDLPSDEIYRNLGQTKGYCLKLEASKIARYASSTIEYRHIGFDRWEGYDLGEQGKIAILRPIVSSSIVDTTLTSAYIIARWKFFLITLGVLFAIFLTFINWLLKKWGVYFPTFAKFFRRKKQDDKTP